MIVSCPNCFLEQPKDQYCAGCGKLMDKLLEEKDQKISKTIKNTNYLIIATTLCFLSGSFYFYQTSKKTDEQVFSTNTLEQAKVELPKDKIIGDKKPAAESFKAYAKETPPPKKTSSKPKVAAKAAILPTQTVAVSGPRIVKAFSFVSLEHCNDVFESGDLTKGELKTLLSCAKVHFTTSRKNFNDIIEDTPSFTTQFSLKYDEYLIELGFVLTTDLYVEEFKQTLPFELEGDSAATLWDNTGHDIESSEPPDKEMLSNYATSALFNFSSDGIQPPQLYFLAQYK